MATILNLKNKPLAAKACGNCTGSSNDGKIRMDRKPNQQKAS
jgi:hypothetical protein